MSIDKIKKIEVVWEGPFSTEEVTRMNSTSDYGIYIVFGPHKVYGLETLLYIGKSEQRTFGVRMLEHLNEDWFGTEQIYIGRLGGETLPTDSDWSEQIDYLETKLIQYCLPSWNLSKFSSASTKSFGEAFIINGGPGNKIFPGLLPLVLCEWVHADSSLKKKTWQLYQNDNLQP